MLGRRAYGRLDIATCKKVQTIKENLRKSANDKSDIAIGKWEILKKN